MSFGELFLKAKLVVAGILVFFLLYFAQATFERTHCVEGTKRCVTIKGPWMRVDSVQHPGEIVLVKKWWLVGLQVRSAKFAFFDEPLGLRGREERFPWGLAESIPAPERIRGRLFEGSEVYYQRTCEMVFSCRVGCTKEIVQVTC